MMRFVLLAPFVTLFTTATAQAAPPQVETLRIRGDIAEAIFGSFDDCGYTDTYVAFSSETLRGPNGWSANGGYLCHSSENWCTSSSLYFCTDVTDATLSLNGTKGAQIQAAGVAYSEIFLGCEFFEGSGEEICEEWIDPDGNIHEYCWTDEGYYECYWESVEVPYALDLTLTPNGVISQGQNTNMHRGPNGLVRQQAVGRFADCELSGGLSVNGEAVPADYGLGVSATITAGSVTKYSW